MLSKKAIIFFFVILILIIGFAFVQKEGDEEDSKPVETVETVETTDSFLKEKQQIDDWIKENDLNQYGDAKDMVYLGGTPLFDETTSQSIDKYEYILQGHPDRPWKK